MCRQWRCLVQSSNMAHYNSSYFVTIFPILCIMCLFGKKNCPLRCSQVQFNNHQTSHWGAFEQYVVFSCSTCFEVKFSWNDFAWGLRCEFWYCIMWKSTPIESIRSASLHTHTMKTIVQFVCLHFHYYIFSFWHFFLCLNNSNINYVSKPHLNTLICQVLGLEKKAPCGGLFSMIKE